MKLKKTRKKWSSEQINDMLRNPFYIGNTIINKYETNCMKKICKKNNNKNNWIIKENTHEAIIEKEIYYKVQEIKESKYSKIKVKHQFLLRDLLYCGICKRKLQYKVYKSSNKQEFLYDSANFNCSLYYKKRCKNKISIKEKNINEIVKNEIIKRLDIIEITNKLSDYYKANDKTVKKIKEYENEIEKLERKKRILYQKKYEQDLSIKEFKIEYEKIKKTIKEFNELIKELEKIKNIKLNEKTKIIYEFKKGNYINNNFLKEFINKIEIYSKNRIEIIFNF